MKGFSPRRRSLGAVTDCDHNPRRREGMGCACSTGAPALRHRAASSPAMEIRPAQTAQRIVVAESLLVRVYVSRPLMAWRRRTATVAPLDNWVATFTAHVATHRHNNPFVGAPTGSRRRC